MTNSKTKQDIYSLLNRIDTYGEILEQPLLRVWVEKLKTELEVLTAEYAVAIVEAEIRGHNNAKNIALKAIEGSQESDMIL